MIPVADAIATLAAPPDARTTILILALGLSALTALVLIIGRLYRRRVLESLRDPHRPIEPPLDVWREAGHRVAIRDDDPAAGSSDSDSDDPDDDEFTPESDDDDPDDRR